MKVGFGSFWAAKHGHADCLRAVLQELSAGIPFSEDEYSGGDCDSAASTAAAYFTDRKAACACWVSWA